MGGLLDFYERGVTFLESIFCAAILLVMGGRMWVEKKYKKVLHRLDIGTTSKGEW